MAAVGARRHDSVPVVEETLRFRAKLVIGFLSWFTGVAFPPCLVAQALPFLAPGDARLRHMVELDGDSGQIPLQTTWPLPTADLPTEERGQLRGYNQPGSATDAGWFLSGASDPTKLRTFSDTPRETGEVGLQSGWAAGDYAGGAIRMSYAIKPKDEMHYRFDGTYAAWRVGNWWISAGVQDRWWGPGWESSLIWSNNARPMPGLALDRASSKPFETKWLRWLGPWRFVAVLDHMENHRPDFDNTLFWGGRFVVAPIRGLELALSRTAQFCGEGHKCGLTTFWDMLIAKSNRSINAIVDQNPSEAALLAQKLSAQVIALDLRWHIDHTPFSFYWQQLGEVFDDKTLRPRQTLELFGVDFASWGVSDGQFRAFAEFTDTACGDISFAKSDQPRYGCAYEKDTWRAGYRYRGRAIGDSMDRDGQRISVGMVITDSSTRSWQLRIRHFDLNRGNIAQVGLVPQTVTTTAEKLWNVEFQADFPIRSLRVSAGVGGDRTERVDGPTGWQGRAFLNLSGQW